MDRPYQPQQNLNFTAPDRRSKNRSYVQMRVTGSFPNSLLGEMVV